MLYAAIAPYISPLDVFYINGLDANESYMRIRQRSCIAAHVGIVVNSDIIDRLPKGKWYLWIPTCALDSSKRHHFGVVIRELEIVLAKHPNSTWGRLYSNPYQRMDVGRIMDEIHSEMRPKSWFDCWCPRHPLTQLDCSGERLWTVDVGSCVYSPEVIALVYQQVGVLNSTFDPSLLSEFMAILPKLTAPLVTVNV